MKLAIALAATLALPLAATAPASAGPCATVYDLPGGLQETVCVLEDPCLVSWYGGGYVIDQVPFCLDTRPFAGCADAGTWRVCFLTDECLLFVTSGRPPGLCV